MNVNLTDLRPGQRLTIADAWDRQLITGKIMKVFSAGFTVEDSRGILHYTRVEKIRDVNPAAPVKVCHDLFGPYA